jgi:hypothetical protein
MINPPFGLWFYSSITDPRSAPNYLHPYIFLLPLCRINLFFQALRQDANEHHGDAVLSAVSS